MGRLAACSDDAPSHVDEGAFATLDGQAPLVIARRGFPGVRPEETQPSYELAADAGADSLEDALIKLINDNGLN